MDELTPKQNQALESYVDGTNFQSFHFLTRLLGVSPVVTRKEKVKLIRHILKVWEERHE